jgi:hypothetical protein
MDTPVHKPEAAVAKRFMNGEVVHWDILVRVRSSPTHAGLCVITAFEQQMAAFSLLLWSQYGQEQRYHNLFPKQRNFRLLIDKNKTSV